jgi:hypothetical protein
VSPHALIPPEYRRDFYFQGPGAHGMKYVTEVSELFQGHCRHVAMLSPRDYVLIAEWEKQEIPLTIVANTMHEVCEKLNGEVTEIQSVEYFQEPIKRNFREWLQSA